MEPALVRRPSEWEVVLGGQKAVAMEKRTGAPV